MRLTRLKITTLPGIEPGFEFVPGAEGVNIVTGPNASGKSSLIRALAYLLQPQKGDPPALSLEAEFDSTGERLRVQRNGNQTLWTCNGEKANAPALPAEGQLGMYRLAMEQLLVESEEDKSLAEKLLHELHGGFDLDTPRDRLPPRFAVNEEKDLRLAQSELRKVEGKYETLRQQEAELPRLDEKIQAAETAQCRHGWLEQAIKLHDAIRDRKAKADELNEFPPDMGQLGGDEVDRLETFEKKWRSLWDEVRQYRADLATHQADLERTGLQQSRPRTEEVETNEQHLQRIDALLVERKRVQTDLTNAEADVRDAIAQFNSHELAPSLDAESIRRSERLVGSLIAAKAQRCELKQQLDLAEEPSHQPQKKGAWRIALPLWMVLCTAVFTGLTAYLQNAWLAVAGAVAASAAALWALVARVRSKVPSPSEEAKRRIRNQIANVNRNLAELEGEQTAFAKELGFDPELPATAFDRFVRFSVQWDKARQSCAQKKAEIENIDQEIKEYTNGVGEFIIQWRGEKTSDFLFPDDRFDEHKIKTEFKSLKKRIDDANKAQGNILKTENDIEGKQNLIESTENDIAEIFRRARLEPKEGVGLDQWAAAKQTLVNRIKRLGDWRFAQQYLTAAWATEKNIRRSLRDRPDKTEHQYLAQCLRWVRTGAIPALQQERDKEARQAAELQTLRDQRTAIRTTLNNAGDDRSLENALDKAMQAQAALEDKRDQAFLVEATNLLLDDVQQAFQAEHEPEVLRRARKLFLEVTSHAFDFELDGDGAFTARNLVQNAPRKLSELSSGTRMQLLLALRLAWIQAQEQGASPLPLFLDEALTTSDEDRFKTMAQSLKLLSEAEGRQIFYLSARRHEPVLWQQAIGNEPAVIDLAAIRFGKENASPPDYAVAMRPSVPPPNGRAPEDYAALLQVPQYHPRAEAGSIHLFHLLRDDLDLLHRLMDAWRIDSLGQLEALLPSSADQGAVADAEVRQRLQCRCDAARHWVALWRQGRGKPVDRSALEQSDAVTSRFIDEAADLAAKLEGSGQALIDALRNGRLPGFLKKKTDGLEQWLIDESYIDSQPSLFADERRRSTLQRAMLQSDADAQDINRLVDWLEVALVEQAR